VADGLSDAVSLVVTDDDPPQSSHLALNSYKRLVEYSLSGILVHRNHRVVYVNEAWARIYGVSREEAMQLDSVDELMHPEDRERVVGYFYKRQRGEAVPEVYDIRIIRSDGEIRTLEMQAFLVDWDGETAGCATVVDVTLAREQARASAEDYKKAEREIALINQAVRQSSDGLVVCDASKPGYPLIFANPAFMAMSGYTESELIGNNCGMLQGPETSAETREEIGRCTRDGLAFSGRILNYRKDGTVFWNRLSISPVKDKRGVLTHFVGTQRDISQQVELNEELLLARRSLDQAYDRIGVVDLDYIYVYANEALCQRFGKNRDDIIGASIPELVGVERFEKRTEPILLRAADGEVVHDTVCMPNADGKTELIEYSATPHYGDNDEIIGITIVSRDKTDEKKARDALAENESRFRDFASLGADIFFEANIEGDLIWMSDGMRNWLQKNRPDDANSNLRTMLVDGISAEELATLVDQIETGQRFHVEHSTTDRAGICKAMEFYGHAYELSTGGRCYRGIGRDLTDQRRAEEQLAWQATHDEMTGLINRRELQVRQIRERTV